MFPGCHQDIRAGVLQALLGSFQGERCPRVTQDAPRLKMKRHSPSVGWIRTSLAPFRQTACDMLHLDGSQGILAGHLEGSHTPGLRPRTDRGRAMAGL